jgi:hypothetical protein
MEITGILHKVLVMKSGTTGKGYWQKQQFVIKTKGSYPKEVCITAFGDNCDLIPNKAGQEVTVHFNPQSKEVGGNYYTDLILTKVEY